MVEDEYVRRSTLQASHGTAWDWTNRQAQAYDLWKRNNSNEQAVHTILEELVRASELTTVQQVNRLMSILDMEMNYTTTERGNYGRNKSLSAGNFKNNEVS